MAMVCFSAVSEHELSWVRGSSAAPDEAAEAEAAGEGPFSACRTLAQSSFRRPERFIVHRRRVLTSRCGCRCAPSFVSGRE